MKLGKFIIDAASVLAGAAAVHLYNRAMTGRDHESSSRSEPSDAIVVGAELDSREKAVLDWRVDQLTRAGFDELRANTLAVVGDWRLAIALVRDGCDHVVAADIAL